MRPPACMIIHSSRDSVRLMLSRTTRQTNSADRIDFLVELAGHTGGRNRASMLSAGAAPLQVAFFGCPNTTDLSTIDSRLTD